MIRTIIFASVMLLAATVAQAALFSGGAAFSSAPSSQLGAVTNNLVITNTANGFTVTGQVLINVPAGAVSGTLASWVVDRPLDPLYGTGSMFTTTTLSGFSQPPIGAFGNTAGNVSSIFTNYPNPSYSAIPMVLTAGAATWSSLTVNSSTFAYTSGGTNYLRQAFFLDGIQFAGPGGTWIVDVPVDTFITVVPEPATVVMLGVGLAGVAAWQVRRRRAVRAFG